MNSLKIKICGMRDPENIRQVCSLNPDYIGFIFYPKSKRFVTDREAKKIVDCVPAQVKKVGVFVNELMPDIIRRVNLFGLEFVQLHGNEPVEYCLELKSIGIKIIKSFGIDEQSDFSKIEPFQNCCDYFLFDSKSPAYGGTGQKFNWQKLSEYTLSKPVFLSGGIGADDATSIKNLSTFRPYALDLNSKFETQPANKDIKVLENFLTEIRKNNI